MFTQEALLDPCFWCRQMPTIIVGDNYLATWVHLCPGNPFLPSPTAEWFGVRGVPIYVVADHWNEMNTKLERDYHALHNN